MIKKLTLLSILTLLFILNLSFTVFATTFDKNNLPCSCDDGVKPTRENLNRSNTLKDKPRFWTESNLKYLTETERKQLYNLQQKIKSGVKLTDEEKKQMWALKDTVVKAKLGDEKFNDFKKLMAKKKNGEKLTEEEITKIKSYFNQIKGE